MKKMTSDNLSAAFAGESQAHMGYLAFADKAEKEGKQQVARLFRAISYAEQVHATNHMKTLGNLGTTLENLDKAIAGENFEVDEMYPAYNAVAELQSENGAIKSIHQAYETEKVHAKMYQAAKDAVSAGNDYSDAQIGVCELCGFTVEGEVPDTCPVCGAKKEKFKLF